MTQKEYRYHEDDFAPGSECPMCERTIVTHFPKMEGLSGEQTHQNHCTIEASLVEPGGFMEEWSADTLIIDHQGPTMEPR